MFSRKQKFPFGKVAVGFGLGAVSGAALALLYAPLTGKKLQKKLAAATEDLVEDVQSTVRRIAKS
jgi:gas vesicle protein